MDCLGQTFPLARCMVHYAIATTVVKPVSKPPTYTDCDSAPSSRILNQSPVCGASGQWGGSKRWRHQFCVGLAFWLGLWLRGGLGHGRPWPRNTATPWTISIWRMESSSLDPCLGPHCVPMGLVLSRTLPALLASNKSACLAQHRTLQDTMLVTQPISLMARNAHARASAPSPTASPQSACTYKHLPPGLRHQSSQSIAKTSSSVCKRQPLFHQGFAPNTSTAPTSWCFHSLPTNKWPRPTSN